MKKLKDAAAIAFVVLLWIFMSAAFIYAPVDEPDPIQQQIKEESMIQGGFGGF
ncbi:MAG: hypothetical protein NC392_09320 [Roseburia sp.]|nr:hypothetical protein [Roseburia sp.]